MPGLDPDVSARGFRRAFIALYFLVSGIMAIWIAADGGPLPGQGPAYPEAWRSWIVLLAVSAAAALLLLRVRSRAVWEALLTATLFLGIWYAALLLLPLAPALILAMAVALLQVLAGRVWSHDLFFLLGTVGLAFSLAGWLPAAAILAGLVGLSAYDIVAGPPGGPMLDVVSALVRRGVVPGLAVPSTAAGLASRLADCLRDPGAALLGAGDLAVPLVAVADAAMAGILPVAAVLSGLMVGVWLLGSRSSLRPRPALPYLALGCGIPYGISFVFGWV